MKQILCLASLLFLILTPIAHALDTHTRAISPVRTWTADDLARFDPSWLHVKFVEGTDVRLDSGRFIDDGGSDLARVNAEIGREAVIEMRRTIPHDRAVLRAWKQEGERRSGVVGPDLSLWFDIRVSGGHTAVARLLNRLNACPEVEIAHPAPIAEPAIIRGDRTPDFTDQQDYLYAPPTGLDAPAAWSHSGGGGGGIKFIDVELAWSQNHEDFDFSKLFYAGGAPENPAYEDHGSAVLGEILAQHNGFGVNGFAPDVNYGTVAIDINEWPNVPNRFQDAIDHLDPGDVWLIELQMFPPGKDATPMEWVQANYDVIWTGVWSRGVVCMEAGANGGQNLDDLSWGGVFDRNVRDSGAIMVAAGTPYGRIAESFTNYGTRMDAHAWGSSIVTTGYGDLYNGGTDQTQYTSSFGGTSGASPMVTGCALCLEGIAQANLGHRIDPISLRTLIHETGVPHLDPHKEIGPRPDLEAAIVELIDYSGAPEPVLAERASALRLAGAPNPCRSSAAIHFTLPSPSDVRLVVVDAGGRCVRTLLAGTVPAGDQLLRWDGRDDIGRDAGSGVFFLRLAAGGEEAVAEVKRVR